jgi:hypothetical protein
VDTYTSSRPSRTLAVGLGDLPAGLAAWIVEKLRAWTDCGGEVETVFTRDELLTWITAYWVGGARSDEPAGGHFAAWEQPVEYAAGVRTAVDLADG